MAEDKIIAVGDEVRTIPLGMENTKNAGRVRFDVSAWLDAYGEGTVEIYHRRSGDDQAYQAAHVSREENIVTWTFDAVDTAAQGYGEASVRFKQGAKYIARSASYITFTGDVVSEAGIVPPTPPEPGGTYEGPYEVTPSDAEQTLETTGLLLTQDVIINPIPSNYGKITWNGATLRVS